ncbi:uncharacterized protein LOC127770583 isoform X2 [Oryza glaberrima]|uniref:uncharacterized protein LOC127770583 isoform X2 n=1 Tax=Oryza glaberrima TaxID=4538 RepID=UPI00224BF63A|nr:uncharacterized protein LOC127770583 isoform X2 [Oryza glaberrima]
MMLRMGRRRQPWTRWGTVAAATSLHITSLAYIGIPSLVITAENVAEAVDSIIDKLKKSDVSNVIYFDGWEGLGASAVLRAVAKRLTPGQIADPELKFEKIIHNDCLMWKSRREMQRKIAEELEISQAKYIFDKQDEDDDFSWINESSRDIIDDIAREINDILMSQRFLVVFHNGSDDEMKMTDVGNFGLPINQKFKGNKMLWTFRGRFRLNNKIQDKVQDADVFLSAKFPDKNHWWDILCVEAEEVAFNTCPEIAKLDKKQIALCWLYISKLNYVGSGIIDYDWTIHASNYWVCDGIIQELDIGDALYQVMRQDSDDPGLHYLMRNTDNWISTSHVFSGNYGFLPVPKVANTVSSFFLAAHQVDTEEDTLGLLAYFSASKLNTAKFLQDFNDMFQPTKNLRVLKLSRCRFRFSSPPFLCCRTLRFLGLDKCLDLETDAREEVQSWTCLYKLWVLDLRYTNWVFSQQMIDKMVNVRELNVEGLSPDNLSHVWGWQSKNIRKLRVMKTIDQESEGIKEAKDTFTLTSSFSQMEKMEILDLSGNSAMQAFPDLSKAECLKTVTVDGCVGLESVSRRNLPASIEVFSLVAASEQYPNAANITSMSLCGCRRLKKLVLSGLPNIEELDLCGTLLEQLDLDAMQARKLRRLLLLGCLYLRAIRWSDARRPQVEELLVDTFGAHPDGNHRQHSLPPVQEDDKSFQSHIVVIDPRLLLSLNIFARTSRFVHCCISPASADHSKGEGASEQGVSKQPWNGHADPKISMNNYKDIFDTVVELSVAPLICPCPPLPLESNCKGSCKVDIISGEKLQGYNNILGVFTDIVDSLNIHDDIYMTSVPGSNWGWLKWCRIEKCPKLHSVFQLRDHEQPIAFSWLETFWASELLTAQSIWNIEFKPVHVDSFKKLQYIHLDSCPRLIHVLPLSKNLPCLEIIQILYCTSLISVFPLNTANSKEAATNESVNFPKLRHIHLHDLPNLNGIYEGKTMSAPKLETVMIRGCWKLRHLPDVTGLLESRQPIVDCEKDWWDNLDGYNQSLYQRRSAQHYKKALPKGSILR